jgi:hypothetical protein
MVAGGAPTTRGLPVGGSSREERTVADWGRLGAEPKEAKRGRHGSHGGGGGHGGSQVGEAAGDSLQGWNGQVPILKTDAARVDLSAVPIQYSTLPILLQWAESHGLPCGDPRIRTSGQHQTAHTFGSLADT